MESRPESCRRVEVESESKIEPQGEMDEEDEAEVSSRTREEIKYKDLTFVCFMEGRLRIRRN
jgi:hypothetical protein